MKTQVEKEEKVWGEVYHIFASDKAAVSVLTVNKGFRCSLHCHHHRYNLFFVESGCICVETVRGSGRHLEVLEEGQSLSVPPYVWHRFRVLESGKVVEVYWPSRYSPVKLDDIQRKDIGGKDNLEELKEAIRCQPVRHAP